MRIRPRRVRTAVLTVLLGFGASAARAQEPEPGAPPVEARVGESDSSQGRPIAESVERAVARAIQKRSPCGPAGEEGVPCFPVLIELEAPEYSVEDGLRNLELDDRPAPGPPSPAELNRYGANPRSASATGSLDPICKTKQLVRKILGKGQTYYVYRVWDHTGERAILRDRPLDPEEFAGAPQFQYEAVGRFGDECEAIKAYRKALREARAPEDPDLLE